jgi:hypothetical protein
VQLSEASETAKQAVIDTWGERLSEPSGAEGEPGSRRYLESQLQRSHEYAPWKQEVLGLDTAAGIDLLDVGCGQGFELARLARAGARVTGVDLVPGHVAQARLNLETLSLGGSVIVADAERLTLEDASFDRVISNNALQFTPISTGRSGRSPGSCTPAARPGSSSTTAARSITGCTASRVGESSAASCCAAARSRRWWPGTSPGAVKGRCRPSMSTPGAGSPGG